MVNQLLQFEIISRNAYLYSVYPTEVKSDIHPFEERRIHPLLPKTVQQLFDNAHYAQATFEAFKYVDKQVARLSKSTESGKKLMMAVFSESTPVLRLSSGTAVSDHDEQEGFKFIFAGSMLAIRNPRGHEYTIHDSIDECLDHLSLASMLLRKLEAVGYNLSEKM